MDRNSVLILMVSMVSVLAGIAIYRYAYSQPEFLGARLMPNSGNSQAVTKNKTLRFEDIILKDLAYQPRHLSAWKEPVLVINFWAPWCAPCRREIPALIELQKTNMDKLKIIGLSFDAVENIVKFQQRHQINYPLLLVQSESNLINQYFGNSSRTLPFTAIMNAQREIVYRHSGEITGTQLAQEISKLH